MKPTLQLNTSQKMTMTPQLQMAIKVLQCSALELEAEVKDKVESNPLLEIDEGHADQAQLSEGLHDLNATDASPQSSDSSSWENNIPQELALDTAWESIYTNSNPVTAGLTSSADLDTLANQSSPETLHQYLLAQIEHLRLTPVDELIALHLVDGISPAGWLDESLDEIVNAINDEHTDVDIELSEAESVLKLIQSLDPVGVGARTLSECLCIQLRTLDTQHPTIARALKIAEHHMALLVSQDFKKLAKRLNCSQGELELSVEIIQQQNPAPGNQFYREQLDYLTPEVIVKPTGQDWVVSINPEVTPRLVINNEYAALIKRGDKSDDNQYLRSSLQDAQWFIKSIESRFDTLFNVASTIVTLQREFFEQGPQAMKPLILADVAQALDLHESTISRATTKKYMLTPWGVFELKYFFSSHVGAGEGEKSSVAIKAVIEKLVSEEPPQKPLSDAKLVSMLDEQGIKVARRTVAKYREALGIEPSSKRKRLK